MWGNRESESESRRLAAHGQGYLNLISPMRKTLRERAVALSAGASRDYSSNRHLYLPPFVAHPFQQHGGKMLYRTQSAYSTSKKACGAVQQGDPNGRKAYCYGKLLCLCNIFEFILAQTLSKMSTSIVFANFTTLQYHYIFN